MLILYKISMGQPGRSKKFNNTYCRHHRPRHLTNSTGSPGVNNLSKSIKPKSITLQVLQLQLYLNEKENSYPCFLQIILFKSSVFYVDMQVMQ